MFSSFRCVDRCVGGYRCLSCHSERAGHWCFFRLHPSIGVPVPLRPVCQRQRNRHWVRILLENVYILSCCVQYTHLNKCLLFFFKAAWLATSTTLSPLREWATRAFSKSFHPVRWSLRVAWMFLNAGLFSFYLICLQQQTRFLTGTTLTFKMETQFKTCHLNNKTVESAHSVQWILIMSGLCYCYSYKDYRSNEDYSLTPQFWLILAVRFAFVILFEVSHNYELIRNC